jgi:acetyltransferase-like isoleucine patch superfamily enzyme
MAGFVTSLRRGKGPFWGTLKVLAQRARSLHVPVPPLARPLFGLLYAAHVGGRDGLAGFLRFFWYEPLFRSQCAAVGPGLVMEQLPYLSGRGKIVLGSGVRLSGKPAFGFSNCHSDTPVLTIGDQTFIGHGCTFTLATAITVGARCLLAGGVRIYDLDGHPLDAARRAAREPAARDDSKPVTLGDDVWVGTGALILKGVTIGPRSVIGAGSVVTADVPPDVVVAGNPARVVKQLSPAGLTCPGSC